MAVLSASETSRESDEDEDSIRGSRKKVAHHRAPKRAKSLKKHREFILKKQQNQRLKSNDKEKTVPRSRNKLKRDDSVVKLPYRRRKTADNDSLCSVEDDSDENVVRKMTKKEFSKIATENSETMHPAVSSNATEVLLAGSVLADEFETYLTSQQNVSEGVKCHLHRLVRIVQTDLQRQNDTAIENIRCVRELRQMNRQQNRLHDQLLKRRRDIDTCKQQSKSYQVQMKQYQKGQEVADRANRFLQSLKQRKNVER